MNKELKNKIIFKNIKTIVTVNNSFSLKNILKEYSIYEVNPKYIDDIYYLYANCDKDIFIINLDITNIEYLFDINKYIKPDIIFIPRIENMYTNTIENKIFKKIKKSFGKLKDKVLVINDNDKYLKKIFKNNLDIYRYGCNMYDDIEYIKKNNEIIINYQDENYILEINDDSLVGVIIIGILFGYYIEDIVNYINKLDKNY